MMSETKFTQDHEWVRVEGNTATIGITDYAQEQLGDIVFVDLPQTGTDISQGDDAAVVESVKAASDIQTPVSGTVESVNDALNDEPGTVNEDPQGDGWFFTVTLSDPGELDGLMDGDTYKAFIATL
jgi:glycine cleavage system H protein